MMEKSKRLSPEDLDKQNRRISEYLTLRETIIREDEILSFYKIGIVRSQRDQVKNVARHVGLEINAPTSS